MNDNEWMSFLLGVMIGLAGLIWLVLIIRLVVDGGL